MIAAAVVAIILAIVVGAGWNHAAGEPLGWGWRAALPLAITLLVLGAIALLSR